MTAKVWVDAAELVRLKLLPYITDERERRTADRIIQILEARGDWEDTDPCATVPDRTPVLGYVVCPRCGTRT